MINLQTFSSFDPSGKISQVITPAKHREKINGRKKRMKKNLRYFGMPEAEVDRICNIENERQRRVEKDMWEFTNKASMLKLQLASGVVDQLPEAVLC